MKSRIRTFLGSLSYKDALFGALIGLLLSAAIQPFAVGFFTDVWVGVGAPGHKPPEVDSDISQIKTGYYPGESVNRFGGLTWKENFETYRVVISNKGSKPVYDLESRVPFPGCVAAISKDTPFSEGNAELTNQISAGISGNNSQSKFQCSKIINVDRLFPGEKVTVDFVIKDQFQQCDVLVSVAKEPEVVTEYRWRKTNQVYSETRINNLSGLESEFNQFQKESSGIMIQASRFRGRVYGVVIPYNTSSISNPREVLQKCHLTLPDGS